MFELDQQHGLPSLTLRERDILRLLANGLTDSEIAEALVLTVGTVKWYNRQIFNKLGVRNRTEAIIRAQQLDLLGSAPLPQVPKHNLPAQVTPFVGREHELAELVKFMDDPTIRLVTILAPGGMGKTRLALESAQQVLDIGLAGSGRKPTRAKFSNGVYFVSLAPLSSPDFIVSTTAEAVNFHFYPGGEPKQQLLDYLREKAMLLVMDNFEHLLAGASIVTDILAYAPGVKIIATSRERLKLSGETVFTIGGMDVPDREDPQDAMDYSAIKLFVQSARRAQPGFGLKADHVRELARICRMVEGMPLAIILSAAWVASLSVGEIADEINQSLDFLQTDLRDVPERQRSIRAVFDYSWKQLTEDERNVFQKLSVFHGGFTREAARAVADTTLEQLARLMDKALLWRSADTGRYEVHELLRQYAEAHLAASGQAAVVRDAHSAYFAGYMAAHEADIKGRRQLPALIEVEQDIENVRAAWFWSSDQALESHLLNMLETLSAYHVIRGHGEMLSALSEYAQERMSISDDSLLRGYLTLYWLATRTSSAANAKAHLERAASIAATHHETRLSALVHRTYGELLISQLKFAEAIPELNQAIDLLHQTGDAFYLPSSYFSAGYAHQQLGESDVDEELRVKGIDIGRQTGNLAGVAWPLNAHAFWTIISREEVAVGLKLEREALQIAERYRVPLYISLISSNLAYFLFFEAQFEEAATLATRAYAMGTMLNNADAKGSAARVLALLAVANQQYDEAIARADEALDGIPPHSPARRSGAYLAQTLVHCRADDPDKIAVALKSFLPRAVDLHEWGLLHQSLIPAAFYFAYRRKRSRAAELLGLALTRRPQGPGWMEKWPPINRLCADLEAELGAEVYNAAWERGRVLDLETVVRDVLGEGEPPARKRDPPVRDST